MNIIGASEKPAIRPVNPCFSSGPCAKRPGWSLDVLRNAFLGRSHRAKGGTAKLMEVIRRSRSVLGVPPEYRIGIVPASDTGAVEMALWSLLGARGVDLFAWESFGATWLADATKHLRLKDVRMLEAPYGELPDLHAADFSRDVVFTWNGTTSGVRVPDGAWIAPERAGLTICDATSAAFATDLPWDRLDVTTYSWQKALGGEAAHGMLILSPRAIERLESYSPPWPLPKIFRLSKGGKLIEDVFKGVTINTPSMLAVEDAIDGLAWAESIGGLPALIVRTERNFRAIESWVDKTPWIQFLASRPSIRSHTSVCLKIVDERVLMLTQEARSSLVKRMVDLLEKEGAGFDLGHHRDAPPGLRIWAGATVETADLNALFPWLDWAFPTVIAEASPSQRARRSTA